MIFFIFKNVSIYYLERDEGWDMNFDNPPIILTLKGTIIKKNNNISLTKRQFEDDINQTDSE